jgi:uncharacterized membrane protein YfcA
MLLSFLFLFTALCYSSVGFGGGSTYLALLILWNFSYTLVPVLALCCNIIVVLGNCINYIRNHQYNFKFLIPYLAGSIPFAYFGGSLLIDKKIFEIFLFIVLSVAGILLLLKFKTYDEKEKKYNKIPNIIAFIIGSILGFVSGVVGIGGGIFLSPILFLLKAEKPKIIITSASIFILINSISGVLGQLSKQGIMSEVLNYWYLFFAVLIGGQIGNFLNIKILTTKILAFITAILVLLVAIRIGLRIF